MGQRADTSAQCFGDLTLEALVAEHPAAVGRLSDVFEEPRIQRIPAQAAIGGATLDITPSQCTIERMLGDEPIGRAAGMRRVTRPPVAARMTHNSGAHGVELDVSTARQEIFLAIDQCRAIPPFPQRPGAPIGVVDVADITPAQCLQRARNTILALGRRKQVYVVGHQDIGKHGAAIFGACIGQPTEVPQVILGREENWLAIVAALDQMHRLTGKEATSEACHHAFHKAPLDSQIKCNT